MSASIQATNSMWAGSREMATFSMFSFCHSSDLVRSWMWSGSSGEVMKKGRSPSWHSTVTSFCPRSCRMWCANLWYSS